VLQINHTSSSLNQIRMRQISNWYWRFEGLQNPSVLHYSPQPKWTFSHI